MTTIELLAALSEAIGPGGLEDEVRDVVLDAVRDVADEVRVDALGNVIATRRGRSADVLMLDAHMDEVGFMVQFVDDAGFLRLTPLGGWDPRVLLAHAVTIRTRDGRRVRGVIGSRPPHILSAEERTRTIPIEDLFVDVGAGSRREVEAIGIGLGDAVVPHYPFETLGNDLVMGKAFDDRAGCTVVIETLRALTGEEPDLTIAAAFTVGEEIGLRGAQTAANQLRPKVALALEGTTATDVPGVAPARRPAEMGRGPAITLADTRLVASRPVVTLLEQCAEKCGVAWQHKLPGYGGTDAGAIHVSGDGVMCGVVSVPCRYIHTPLSMLRPTDLAATVHLTVEFARAAGSLLV